MQRQAVSFSCKCGLRYIYVFSLDGYAILLSLSHNLFAWKKPEEKFRLFLSWFKFSTAHDTLNEAGMLCNVSNPSRSLFVASSALCSYMCSSSCSYVKYMSRCLCDMYMSKLMDEKTAYKVHRIRTWLCFNPLKPDTLDIGIFKWRCNWTICPNGRKTKCIYLIAN